MRLFREQLLLLISLLSLNAAIAQKKLLGHVSDSSNRPLPSVYAVLLLGGKYITSCYSDSLGAFELDPGDRFKLPLSLQLSLPGYKTFKTVLSDTGSNPLRIAVRLGEQNALKSVTVTGKANLVTRKADRFSINIENGPLSSGNSGFEVLQKSPGIWASEDGSLRIKGSQPAIVMINNVVQRMSASELSIYLRTLRSEDISRIEIIPNPPAEYEASGNGGIVNIILKRPKTEGLASSLFGTYGDQKNANNANAGLSMDYKKNNIYLSGSYSFSKENSSIFATNDIIYPNKGLYHSQTDRKDRTQGQPYRIGATVDLGKGGVVGIQNMGGVSELNQVFVTSTNYNAQDKITEGTANSRRRKTSSLNSTTMNYSLKTDTAGSTLKLIGDYTRSNVSDVNEFTSIFNDPTQNTTFTNRTPSNTRMFSLQADYIWMLRKSLTLKGGAKFVSTKRDNNIIRDDLINDKWVMDSAGSDHFIYTENIFMAYSSAEQKFGSFDVQAGLRMEKTFSDGNSISSNQSFSRSYLDFFPSLFLSQGLGKEKNSTLYLSYSRRIRRPSYTDLNPYRLQFDNYTIQAGNPDLRPQYANNVELGCNFQGGYSTSAFFSRTSGIIAQLAIPIDSSVIEYQSNNLDFSEEYGLNFSAPLKLFKWWSTNSSASFFNLIYQNQAYRNHQVSYSLKSVQSITLERIFDIDIIPAYYSARVSANTRTGDLFFVDLALSRTFFNNRARIKLFVSDVFNTIREKEITDYDNTHIDFYQKRPTRRFGIAFTYTFQKGMGFKNKKIEQGGSEEKSRL